MPVPFLDLRAQHAAIAGEVREAVDEVFAEQSFILGPAVARFERSLGQLLGAQHVVGVASGSDALFLIMLALGIGAGDAVITTPFSFIATATAIIRTGARPLFADIDPESFNLDPAAVRKLCERECEKDAAGSLWHRPSGCRVKAVLPVHIFGRVADMEGICHLANEFRLEIVEDAAQAAGARVRVGGKERAAGTVGAAGAFSFYPSKNLGGAGDGGAVVSNREKLAGLVRSLATHGDDGEYVHRLVGYNSRLDSLQAAVLGVKLKHLEKWNRRRRELALLYSGLIKERELGNTVSVPGAGEPGGHVFHQYVIRVGHRDQVREALARRGIEARVYYPCPLHLQPGLSELGYGRGDFPHAERLSSEVLSLPLYPELEDSVVAQVASALAEAVA